MANSNESRYMIYGKTVIRAGWHLPKWQNIRDLHKDQNCIYLILVKDLIEDQHLLNLINSADAGDKESIKRLNNWIFNIGEKAGKQIAFKLIENGDNIEQEIEYIIAMLDNREFVPLKHIQ